MTIEIRRTQPGEVRAVTNVIADALMFPRMTDEVFALREPTYFDHDSIAAWDGDRAVGHVGALRFDTTVPGGGRLKTSAVTRVGVLATHTRRGLLTSMMTRLLTDARSDGTVLASLRASEAVIYQRYGFAVAGEAVTPVVAARTARPLRSEPASGSVELLAADQIMAVVPALYDACARHGVGTTSRPDFMWQLILESAIEVKTPSFAAVHRNEIGELDGYVLYDVKWAEQANGDDKSIGTIHDLFGADPGVERALWAFVLGIDLVQSWTADCRPVDDPIRFALHDPRAYEVRSRWDEQWLRVLDVDVALASRTYRNGTAAVVVAVDDPLFADNCGTWRIDVAGAARSDGEPDLAVSIGALSAAYLGGTSWTELAAAGLIEIRRAGAVADADVLFGAQPRPFCGTFF